MTAADQTEAALRFLTGCREAGLAHVVVSPGSRSTPLALAADSLGGVGCSMHLDERTAAFAALGHAKITGRPVALVCTSGTAGANYLPAIAEARQSLVPLIAITADRPPEHQGWGVGQTFDQTRLYGVHVVDFVQMPVGGDGGLPHALRAGRRAVATALDTPGPVHVNWPFRLPLEPTTIPAEIPSDQYVPPGRPRSSPTADTTTRFAELLDRHPRAVIVAGPGTVAPGPDADDRRRRIRAAAARTRIPILADALSGLRGEADTTPIVEAADLLVASGAAPPPDLILRLGDTPTAKAVRLWWEGLDAAHVLLDPAARGHDPSHLATQAFADDPVELFESLPDRRENGWATTWVELGRSARQSADRALARHEAWSEAHIARDLGRQLAGTDTIVVASSSMPVRDVDTFFAATDDITVISNRGINGIDGVISTSIGVARGRPASDVVVLIGDIAVLHDVGGLLDAARQGVDLVVVVPNNDGGGIFSFLPVRQVLDNGSFDRLFHTPHGTRFDFLGGHPRIHHELVDREGFAAALSTARGRGGVSVIEIDVDTGDNVRLHEEVVGAVRADLGR